MDASRLFPTFHRLLCGLRVLRARPHPPGARVRAGLAPQLLPAPPLAAAGVGAAVPIQVSAPVPAPQSAAARSLRTLEEVRADLARLREQARKRQAVETRIRRDISFAPTDFMDFATPAPKAAQKNHEEAPFPATDFMDFGAPSAPVSTPAEAPFPSTDYLDFTVLKPR